MPSSRNLSWIELRRIIVYTIVVAALLSPLVTGSDSFPLSTYPMYASARADTADLVTAVGIGADGSLQRLGLRVIGDSDDPLIVESAVRRAVTNRTATELCELIAQRVAPRTVSAVEVVTERYVLADIARDASVIPIQRVVHARCDT